MIDAEKAKHLHYGEELHYGTCHKIIGPRGGTTLYTETWRVSGQLKLWKRQLYRFELPIRWGLYAHAYMTEFNGENFHRACECLPSIIDKRRLQK